MPTFSIAADTPFSLEAAAGFGFGPNTGRPTPDETGMRLAFVTDDLAGYAAVHLTQRDATTVDAQMTGDADPDAVKRQVSRVLSLDSPGAPWLEVGDRDPVIGELQATYPGLRPVLFHSPYEAAAWSIISARRSRLQATAIRARLAQAFGREFTVGGQPIHAFPTPGELLTVGEFPSLEQTRIDRLHAVARAALDGGLDPARLAALEAGQALAEVQRIPGIGPTYGTLIVLRSTGVTDMMTLTEPRLASYAAHFYERGSQLTAPQLAELAEKWRPYRTWTSVLIRVAGDRANLPIPAEPATRGRRHSHR